MRCFRYVISLAGSRRPKRIHGDHIAKDLFRLREKIEIMHKVSHFYYVIFTAVQNKLGTSIKQ